VGICVPSQCNSTVLSVFTPFFEAMAEFSGQVYKPMNVYFDFPSEMTNMIYQDDLTGFLCTVSVIFFFFILGILGMVVQYKNFGNKSDIRLIIEVDEDTNNL